MKPDEVTKAVKLLGDLFPGQLTTETVKLLREQWLPLSFDAVSKACKAHKCSPDLKDGFMHVGKLLEGCRAAAHAEKAQTLTTSREGSWCDVRRRQNPQLAGRCDVEVIVRVHRDWWWRDRDRKGEGYRRQIEASLLYLLHDAGDGAAEAWVPYVFDAEPVDFAQSLRDLRGEVVAT